MRKMLFLLIAVCAGCLNPKESQNKINNSDQIPVLAWYSIPQEETNLFRYQELKETGITLSLSNFSDVESMSQALDTAQKAGIKMIISCPELKTKTEETVKRFMNHPALAGYMLRDEPNRTDFPALGEWAKKIRSIDDNHFCYLNLFPNYANEQQLGTKTYKEHVDLFMKEVSLQLLSFDHYPVLGDSLRYNWYENLEIISDAARKAGKPFWAFALSVDHGPYPIPTVAQLRLQVFSDLAYGAQGIQYFTYWTPYDTIWKFNNAPVTLEGKRTVVYDRVKQVNGEIKNLSGVFLGASVISVAHTGAKIPVGTNQLLELPQPVKTLKTEGTGAVVSVLKNGVNSYLIIVNRDFKNTMKLSIECDAKVKKVFKDGSVLPANLYKSDTEIDPGDIAIYTWID
ncbi:MAG: beta-galactosidase [Bacteroidota bacterium]